MLIDSGNLFSDLISEKLAKQLKLPITGSPRTVGTASSNGNVTIIGRTKPFGLYIEGINEAIQIHPFVVKDLAHNINLGQDFLRRYGADMTFRPDGIQLRLKGSSTMLKSSSASITRRSIDTRINRVLDKLKDQANNPMAMDNILDLRITEVNSDLPGVLYAEKKKPVICSNTKHNIHSHKEVLLHAGCNSVVDLVLEQDHCNLLTENNVLLEPSRDRKFLNKNLVFVQPGFYYRKGNTVSVLISNFNDKDITLPSNYKIGHILEGIGYAENNINTFIS